MNIFLKVKINTLTAESHIIRVQQKNLLKRAGKPPAKILVKEEQSQADYAALRLEKKLYKARIAKIKMGKVWPSLQNHRRGIVRQEARHSFIAYAFLRERPYSTIEKFCYMSPDWAAVEKIVRRFTLETDPRILAQRFEEWKQRGRQDQDNYQSGQQTTQASDDKTRLSA